MALTKVEEEGINFDTGSILEIVSSVCDGSTVNGYTFENVTASQSLATSYADTTGSSISYTPPSGATQVIYSFNYMAGFNDNHAIASHKFFIDSDEVVYARTTHGALNNGHFRITFIWTINIGGTADTIDVEIQAMTGTTTGGVIRMFAVCMNVDDTGDMTANEVDRDTLA